MIFSSATFLVFLALVLGGTALLHREAHRRALLFVASFVFYGWWDWRFCFFLIGASTIDYRLALEIQRATTPAAKRTWLLVSICSNLGILAGFKYAAWVVTNINAIAGTDLAVPEIPLPLGISFFTFQAMSYTIDVYRGHFNPTHRWFDFAFSMSFFPHLISGPIVRAAHFMPQLAKEHPLRSDDLIDGLTQFSRGFVKKTFIADHLGVWADGVFADPAFFSSWTCWLGVVAYTGQIYYDFSGYTDMAIGLARMFGFQFPNNFDHPYLATSITDFWRRWHISLSSWLRDYLYFSLGGNRRGRARTYVNLLLTMLLGGLWHGASWTFVVWGGLHGLGLAVHKWMMEVWPEPGRLRRAMGGPFTLLFVMVCWVFFRAPNFDVAATMLRKMLFITPQGCDWPYVQGLIALAIGVATHAWTARGGQVGVDLRKPFGVALLLTVLVLDLLHAPLGHSPFIYFQF